MGDEAKSDGTVGKALDVLDIVAAAERPLRFMDLMAASPFPKATLYRFLQVLTHQGMLTYDPDRQTYTLGIRLVRLAHSAWRQASLAPLARPFINDLCAKVGETIHLAQLDHGQVLFVDKQIGSDMFDTLAQAGKIAPAYCTGVGKAILAFMPPERRDRALKQQAYLQYTKNTHACPETLAAELLQIREEGVAFDREEHEMGIISIAAPILTGKRVVGAMSIATSTTRKSLADLEDLRPIIKECAAKIGAEAEIWQFPEQL